MPVLRSSQIGDLYVQLDIEVPQNLNRRQKELLEEFQSLSTKDNNPTSSGFFSKLKGLFD
jgi:molecular chaperone DnaJ